MKRALFVTFVVALFAGTGVARAGEILLVNFESALSFTVGGGGAAYWGIAPLGGAAGINSGFVQGGSQSGSIFYGSFAKETDSSPAATMTIALPDLSAYENLMLTVSLAAQAGVWETTHRDSLRIIGGTEGASVPVVDCSLANGCVDVPGTIDKFLPPYYGASLRSQANSAYLGLTFQDLQYAIGSDLRLLTFAFASTDYPELVGIDSVNITGDLKCSEFPGGGATGGCFPGGGHGGTFVPDPGSTLLLLGISLVGLGTVRRRLRM